MARLFSPVANTIARASLVAAVAVPVGAIVMGSVVSRSPANTNVGVAFDQPVPFSHAHHSIELGIDCRYCHTSVTKSSSAGIPSTETCMSCHSQIWTDSPLLEPVRQSWAEGKPIRFASTGEVGWNRVAKVPEFVYFNHSIHIARGIQCNECHGNIQEQHMTAKGKPFFMKWCLDCHRKPEKALYVDEQQPDLTPQEKVFAFYRKIQEGAKLSARELALKKGREYQPTAAELEKGREMVQKMDIKVKTLADCYICHR